MSEVVQHDFKFFGNETPPVVGSPDGLFWRSKDTSVTGSPTIVGAGGSMVLTLDAEVEAENLCLYFGDILSLDIDNLKSIEMWVQCSATLIAGVDIAFGVASERNDAIDTIAEQALFRVIGAGAAAGAVTVETDDGTNNNDDIATGQTLAASIKRCMIEFDTGVATQDVRDGGGVGGKADVLFSMDNGSGLLQPVARNTRFDMSNYSGGLQPYLQIQKTASASAASVSLKRVRVTEKFPF